MILRRGRNNRTLFKLVDPFIAQDWNQVLFKRHRGHVKEIELLNCYLESDISNLWHKKHFKKRMHKLGHLKNKYQAPTGEGVDGDEENDSPSTHMSMQVDTSATNPSLNKKPSVLGQTSIEYFQSEEDAFLANNNSRKLMPKAPFWLEYETRYKQLDNASDDDYDSDSSAFGPLNREDEKQIKK